MDTNPPLTTYTRISPDSIPLAHILIKACAIAGMQERIFNLVRALLREEVPEVTDLSPEVIAAVPRLRALDKRSLEMVGYVFGDIKAPVINSHPYFVAMDSLAAARYVKAITRNDLRRLIDLFKEPSASMPDDLPLACLEAGQVMGLLSTERVLELERSFFTEPHGDGYPLDEEETR